MLNYSIKLGEDNIKRDKLVWSEKFVAPDLSFVTGVTSQDYHIDKDEYISASIGVNSNFSRLKVTSENVTRNGYIKIKDKEYKIQTSRKTDYSGTTFNYAEINGVYYYIDGGATTITVKNWLQEKWTKVEKDDKSVEYKVDIVEGDAMGTIVKENDVPKIVKLDTIVWIEDETVTIDGHKYIFDQYDISEFSDSPGGIKYYEAGRSLSPTEITACSSIIFNHFSKISEYKYVTKFTLRKTEDESYNYDKLSYCTYFYYAFYKDYYCPVRKDGDKYVCDVPKRFIEEGYTGQETSAITVEFRHDEYTPTRISQLKDYESYVKINNIEVDIEYMIQNANGGDEIAIYLSDDSHNINTGDKITLSYESAEESSSPVYAISGVSFVLYDNVKYLVESAITDTIDIEGAEYDISYPNGKVEGENALVDTDGELIPMLISGDSLYRYGLIVSGDSAATTVSYPIVTHDGVMIDDVAYRVIGSDDTRYIVTPRQGTTEFNVLSIEGSSLLICEPNLNTTEYDEAFIDEMSSILCDYYVSRQEHVKVYSKNRAFGSRVITSNVGFVNNSGATSSSDYDDILNNLVLFVNSGYIQIKLPMTMNVANNAMQEDIVEKDFYEAEKEKAINSIVDMEKDVYEPMYMREHYSGSTTNFYPVTDIEVNLHFRTRDFDQINGNWRVYDGYNNFEVSGVSDNWFCTDLYPYAQMLSGVTGADRVIMTSSDLMGLLFFDNDDVFYQKDSIAKSFLRFSYYDSPDPNTQSLLCTSTVFMDEHAMYKKFIDNSRKNINDYGIVQRQEYVTGRTESGTEYIEIPQRVVDNFSGDAINRISVYAPTEILTGGHRNRRTNYRENDVDIEAMESDKQRISSRFTINNKYATDTSSEGFYLYIFREYSENLHPKPIYMKIEFNHAGVGRTIPFIVPMRWSGGTNTDNEMLPVSALTLSGDDLVYLKEGYPLSYVYAQTYIPLYAVYDFKHKKYAYVFDDRYIDTGLLHRENKIRLNLFEIKVKNEDTANTRAREQVRNNNIERANININTAQFNDNI